MPAERYFAPIQFQEESTIHLEDQEFHHLVHVMRLRIDDEVELINGVGQLATATIRSIEKKRALLSITHVDTQIRPSKKLILAQALPRFNRLENILEKGTELGVTDIWLFPGTRSENKGNAETRMQRTDTILISAVKQCGRLFLPELSFQPPISKWTSLSQPTFFGDVRSTAPLLIDKWHKTADKSAIMFCVGPESGFSEEEVVKLEQLGACGVKLHENILRTDTAAIAGLSLLSHLQKQ